MTTLRRAELEACVTNGVPEPSAEPEANVPAVFALGGNSSTLAFVNSFRPESGAITARLLPIAWTPLGVVLGDTWQNVGVALAALMDWVDKTFSPEDERSFVAPMRDIELLARVQWHSIVPERLDEAVFINAEDIPDEIMESLAHPPAQIVQCAACRRLCVRDEFVWKEKQLCAWDFHAQAFGKRGPWRNGPYEERHFETLPSCAYVAPGLLAELNVQAVLATANIDAAVARGAINLLLEADPSSAHLAVRIEDGFTLLRETPAQA
jgi:hypothetical protein